MNESAPAFAAVDATHALVEQALEAPAQPSRGVISQRVACHVVWHFGDQNLGLEPGKFVERLMLLIVASDERNRELLSGVYPEYVRAVNAVQREPWGFDWLRAIAREVGA